MKVSKLTFILGIILIFTVAVSCVTNVAPDCLGKDAKDLILRWGEYSSKSSVITYYEIKTDRIISLAVQENKNSEPKLQVVGKISEETFCKLIKQTKANIMLVQALNVPSDVNNFVEYIEKSKSFHFRATWNPNHDNRGNKEFKALFVQLQEAVIEAGK